LGIVTGSAAFARTTFALLIWACAYSTVLAQTPEACKADLQHLTLPQTVQLDDGNGETPVQFLFSDHGADIYSAIPSSEPNGIVWFISNGIRIIVVYQDERARQQAIRNLSQPGVVADVMAGSSTHGTLDELKFAVVHLGVGSSSDKPDEAYIREHYSAQESYLHELIASQWHVEGIQYFEPASCVRPKQEFCLNSTGQMVPCVSHSLRASDGDPNWITDLNIDPTKRKPEPNDPQFVRIVGAMKEKLKEFADRDKGRAVPLAH
jgi:hypothetical protein